MTAAPSLRSLWPLDPSWAFLNHGSFGACPTAVLAEQARQRQEMEAQPVEFLDRRLPELREEARRALARFLGADPEGLVPVANATTGVNAVLRSLTLAAGDELLTTDHAYHACANALEFVAKRAAATVVVVRIPFPLEHPARVVEAILAAVTPRTRLVLVDHVTSPTGLVLPVADIVAALAARGVDTLVDGAHAPGMVDLDLDGLGAAWYTGNCHKWLCAPKGAAFLWARQDRREGLHPVVISHGYDGAYPGRTRLQAEFDWTGTDDPTPFLTVPFALRYLESLLPGGWPEIRARNRKLVRRGRDLLLEALGGESPCPDEMVGSLVAVVLPEAVGAASPFPAGDPLQEELARRHRIEVPVKVWPAWPHRLLRISAQLYNCEEEYARLADGLRELVQSWGHRALPRPRGPESRPV